MLRSPLRITLLMALLVLLLSSAVQAQQAIDFGDNVDAVLSVSGTAEYQFTGEEGQFVTITLVSDEFDAYLRLFDANNNALAEDDDSAGGLNSRIGPFRLPANGVYTIVASSLNQSDVGAYTLSLGQTSVRRIEYSQQVMDELSPQESIVDYLFTGQAGDTISIDLMSDDFDSYLRLLSASPSAELTTNDDGGNGLNSRIGPFTLDQTGDYVIRVSALGNASESGAYTLALNRIKLSSLVFDTINKAEVSGNRSLYFSFEGRTDQIIDIRVDSADSLDTILTLIGPDSNELASDDDGSGGIDPFISGVMLPQDGTYYAILQPNVSRDSVTSLNVLLTESELVSLDDGPQMIRFGELANNQFVTFSGSANEAVTIHVDIDLETPMSPNIIVTQRGEQIASLTTYTITGELSFGFVTPDDGPVNVEFVDYDLQEAALTVTLERR